MKTAFAIGAHPDDIEFLMSGTMMRLADTGYHLHYMNVANGCCGSTLYSPEETARIRQLESQAAAEFVGATFHPPLCNDLEIFYQKETLEQLTSIIRIVRPEIILTHSPTDYMEDHTNTCRLAVTAAFCRGMPNYATQLPTDVSTQAVTLYHAQPYSHHDPLGNLIYPQYYVDVADLQQRKQSMLSLHASQKQWLDESQGLDSYLKTMSELDEKLGMMSGQFSHAEGWRRHLHLGFCSPDDDPLLAALSDSIYQA